MSEIRREAMGRKSTLRRVRKGKGRAREEGFIVTWDVNSADRAAAHRLQRFIFGDVVKANGRTYRYPGFVEKQGVRYLGQSVLFVRPRLLEEVDSFLSNHGIEHEITPAGVG